jgi:hypothetical protein
MALTAPLCYCNNLPAAKVRCGGAFFVGISGESVVGGESMSSQTEGNAVQFQLWARDRRLEVRATVPGGGEGWAETDMPAVGGHQRQRTAFSPKT